MEGQVDTVESSESQHPRRSEATAARWLAAGLLVGCAGVLSLAIWCAPDARGYGTHEQFGSGPCGFVLVTGYPCPTCGMTTAFAHTVRGQWWRAFWAQPAGFVLALATIAAAGIGVWVLVAGRWPRRFAMLVSSFRFFLGLLVLLLGGWAFKLVLGLLDGTLPVR